MHGGGFASISHKFIHPTSIEQLNTLVLLFHYPPFYLKFLQFIDLYHYQFRLSALSLSLLEFYITSNVDLIVVGDFSIHTDKQNDPTIVVFNSLLLLILVGILPFQLMIPVIFST